MTTEKTCKTCVFSFKFISQKNRICKHPEGACKTKKLEKYLSKKGRIGGIIPSVDRLDLKELIEVQKLIALDYMLLAVLSARVQSRINSLTPKKHDSNDNEYIRNGAVITGLEYGKIYDKAKDKYNISTLFMRSNNNLAMAEIKRFKLGGVMDHHKIRFNSKYNLVVMEHNITKKGTAFFYK